MPNDLFCIYSVTLNKRRVDEHLQTKAGKKKLYNFLARFIIEKTPIARTKDSTVSFAVDKCKNKKEIKDFNQYIENQIATKMTPKS